MNLNHQSHRCLSVSLPPPQNHHHYSKTTIVIVTKPQVLYLISHQRNGIRPTVARIIKISTTTIIMLSPPVLPSHKGAFDIRRQAQRFSQTTITTITKPLSTITIKFKSPLQPLNCQHHTTTNPPTLRHSYQSIDTISTNPPLKSIATTTTIILPSIHQLTIHQPRHQHHLYQPIIDTNNNIITKPPPNKLQILPLTNH